MRLLMVDHNDSFTFNLVDIFRELGADVEVVNYKSLPFVGRGASALILSPGPGCPREYPETRVLLDHWPADRPLLGVCLGMQILNEWSGGETVHAMQIVHGKTCPVFHDGNGIFDDLANPCTVMRYHSLACRVTSTDWKVCARTQDDTPMAICHHTRPWWGVQFHPESFLTLEGSTMLKNWISTTM